MGRSPNNHSKKFKKYNSDPKEVSIDYATFDAVEQDRCQDLSSISSPSSKVRLLGNNDCKRESTGQGFVDIRPINKRDYHIDSDDNGDKDWPGSSSTNNKVSELHSTPPRKSKSNNKKMSPPGTSSKKKRQSSSSSWGGWFGNNDSSNTTSNNGRRRNGSGHNRADSLSGGSTASFSQSEDFQRIFDDDDGSSDNKLSEMYSVGKKSPPKGKGSTSSGSDYYAYTEDAYDVDDGSQDPNKTEIYFVAQRYGYCSIVFSLCQTGILATMMINCGIAPFNINPMIGPYPDALSEWGAKNSVNILQDGEWYRLITPIMLHAGVIHLLCNVAVQVETGAFFEREWGSKNWLIIYLSSAVGSSILSVIFMPGMLRLFYGLLRS